MPGRHIPLEGAYNFRDLGGLVGAGGRPIASGRVFRSDRLSRLSENDRQLLEAKGIRRVYDLRSTAELAADGIGAFAAAADRHRHVPLVGVSLSATDPAIDWTRIDLQSRYLEMLVEGAPVIRGVLEWLAEAAERDATVIHCTGGKDRTGVVVAVLERALGVDDADIVDDYAVSERLLAPVVEASRELLTAEGFDPAVILYLCGSPAERMVKMLADMDSRWGGVGGYLDSIGVSGETVALLRESLLASS